MKIKKIVLLLMLTLLFVGLSYASEVSNDTTNTADTSIADTTDNVVHSSNTPIKEDNSLTDKTKTNDEITKQYSNTVKTATSKTYTVNDFDTLHNALTSDTYTTVTINIKSNIKLTDNTRLNDAIETLTINGNEKTINGAGKYQFLSIGLDSKVIIKNLKITKCYAEKGGAIYKYGNTLTIDNSQFINNHAEAGGAIYNDEGTLKITNTILNNNNASYGGAIYDEVGIITITKSTLLNNTAINYGGAIETSGLITINNSTINGNTANEYGGAIENLGDMIITNSIINNNNATYGGAIDNWNANLNITKSTLNYNKAGKEGGAVYSFKKPGLNIVSTLNIINSTLNNNQAENGGAIYNYPSNLTVTGSTLKNNKAKNRGGAIDSCYGNNTKLKNNIFTSNTATLGSAISLIGYYETVTEEIVIKKGEWIPEHQLMNGNVYVYGPGGIPVMVPGHYEGRETQTVEVTNYYGKDIAIDGNTFIKNKATTKGKAIINNGTNNTIKNNINENSKDSATIYLNTTTTKITNNVFDDGRKTTLITVGSSKNVPINKQMSIYGKLTDKDGNNLANQTITIKVDGKTITTTTTQYGNYNIKITPTTTGTKTITATFAGTSTYLSSVASSTFSVKYSTVITVGSSKTVGTGKQMSIYGKLTDNNNNNLANQSITIKVDGKTITTTTTQYGNYNIKFTPTTTGTKTITATYAGTSTYLSSVASSTFTVKNSTVISVGSSKTVGTGKQMSIYGKLTDNNNNNLANQTITIKVDGKTITTTTTQYGNYNIKFTPTTTGTKTITATYAGTSTYLSSVASSTFSVKYSTVISVGSSKTVGTGKQMSIYGKLTDNNNNNLANQTITIKVDGKTYTTTTTLYGNYNIKITPTTTGTKTITVNYDGTSTYLSSVASSTFTVKYSTVITVGSSKTVATGKQMSIYGKLTDNNNKNLANQAITIKVDGKTYTTTTTQYGNYNIKFTPTTTGTKTITVNYAGNNINLAATNSTTFLVKSS